MICKSKLSTYAIPVKIFLKLKPLAGYGTRTLADNGKKNVKFCKAS